MNENMRELKRLKNRVKKLERYKTLYEDTIKIKNQYHTIFNTIRECVIIEDKDGIIVEANRYASKKYGWSHRELIGKNAIELIHPEYHHVFKKLKKQLLSKGNFKGQTVDIKKDGTTFIANVKGKRIDFNGKPHFLEIINDVSNEIQYQERIKNLNQTLKEEVKLKTTKLKQINKYLKRQLDVKEKQKEKLYISEGRFKSIASGALDGIILIDSDGRVQFSNKRARKILGYSQKELDQKYVHNLLAPQKYQERIKKGLAIFKKTGKGPTVGTVSEMEAIKKNGVLIKIEITISPFKSGDRYNAIGIFRDITQKNEEKLKFAKTLKILNRIVSNSIMGIIIYRNDGQCYFSNEMAAKMIGAKSNLEVMKQNFHHIESWKKSGLYEAALDSIQFVRKNVVRVHLPRTSFGKNVWLQCYLIPLEQENNIELLLMIHDVTEIIKKKNLLRVINSLYNESYNLSSYREISEFCLKKAEIITNSQFGFIGEVNEFGKLDTTGMTDPGWDTCRIEKSKAVNLIENMELVSYWGRVAKDGTPVIVNNPLNHPDSKGLPEGHPPITSFIGIPLKKAEKTIGMIGLANNPLGYSEEDKHNLIELSHAIVQTLTRKRLENSIEEANQELKRSNRELDDFAYIASHDLKEPLRALQSFSQILKKDYENKIDLEGQNHLNTLIRMTKRLEKLIDVLLKYSRLGRQEPTLGLNNLNDILKDALENISLQIKENNIQLKIPRPLPEVLCDRIYMTELFANLISNACKYNNKPNKWIEIGYDDKSLNNPYLFYIKDNGIGIKEKHIDIVFKIFKRLHGRNKFGGGTGAGLTIAKKIIDLHKGRIWIESENQKGTVVNFTLSEKIEKK